MVNEAAYIVKLGVGPIYIKNIYVQSGRLCSGIHSLSAY